MHHQLLDMVSSPDFCERTCPFLLPVHQEYIVPWSQSYSVNNGKQQEREHGSETAGRFVSNKPRGPTKSTVVSGLRVSSRVKLGLHQIIGTALSAGSFPPLLLSAAQPQTEFGHLLTSDIFVEENNNNVGVRQAVHWRLYLWVSSQLLYCSWLLRASDFAWRWPRPHASE